MGDMPLDVREILKDLANPFVERCGYILNDWTMVLMRNISKSPGDSFSFDRNQQLALVRDSRYRIMGIFHTHPAGKLEPSEKDVKGWPPIPGLRYWIVNENRVAEWGWKNGSPVYIQDA